MNLRRAGLALFGALLVGAALRLGFPQSGAPAPSAMAPTALPPSPAPARLALGPRSLSASGAEETRSPLPDLPWRSATTGWQVLADYDTPLKDSSFTWGPMVVAGELFERGIGTYPFSEIVYELDGRGLRFTARVGITDDSKAAAGSARFFVYGDEFLLYESGVLRAGEPARTVEVALDGLDCLVLVVDDAGDGSMGDYALWGDPYLASASGPAPAEALASIAEARRQALAAETPALQLERATLGSTGAQLRDAVRRWLPADQRASADLDAASSALVMANEHIVVGLGYGGARRGKLTVALRGGGDPVLVDLSPAVITAEGRVLRLAEMSFESGSFAVDPIRDPWEGGGVKATARFRPSGMSGHVRVSLVVFDDGAVLRLHLTTEGIPLRAVHYFEHESSGLALGERVRYATDRSHLYLGEVRRDGHTRRAPLEATKPALLWSDREAQGLLLWLPDHVASPTWLSMRSSPGSQAVQLGVQLEALLDDFGPGSTAPPPLSIQLVEGPIGQQTFARYRRSMEARYPPAPWPASARYQWGSWYAFGPGVTASALQRQIDLIGAAFGDLGPWQLLIDAGWFVQYGREDAEPSAVDFDKFPGGVRAVADAAHARGMEVLLYLGTGFIHDSPADGGEWLALRGLIERHPEWMISFQPEKTPVRRFLLDYANPEVQRYVASVIADFFRVHGVDGILLDGLADAEGQLIPRIERDGPSGPLYPLLPALDIYRLVHDEAERHRPGAFITNGWVNPIAAHPYAHVFYYGDESDLPDAPYPFGGFLQKLDYALFSRLALGQRSYVGAARGDPSRPEARWWVQAGAALGSPAGLGLDLAQLNASSLAAFRADLRGLDPFQGETRFGPGLLPDYFATQHEGVTYLGVVNREPTARELPVSLGTLGLSASRLYTALDVSTGVGREVTDELTVPLPARSFRLLVLREEPGVLWTSSVVGGHAVGGSGLTMTLSGPGGAPGFVRIATPSPTSVLLDGVALQPTSGAPGEGQYTYAGGVVSLSYAHRGVRRLEVRWRTG